MEKRVLLAFALSFLVWFAYQSLIGPPPTSRPATPARTETGSPQAPAAGTPADPSSAPAAAPSAAVSPASVPPVSGEPEREIVVETDTVRATFTNREGVLKSWRLKRYLDSGGQPLELVPQTLPTGTPEPFSVRLDDPAANASLESAVFRASAQDLRVDSAAETLTLDYKDGSGLSVTKSFTFDPAKPYVLGVAVRAESGGKPINAAVQFGPALGPGFDPSGSQTYYLPRGVYLKDGDVERLTPGDLADPADAVQQGTFEFCGADDHYFLSAFVRPPPLRLEYQPLTIPAADGRPVRAYVAYTTRPASPPETPLQLFLGPKDFDVLAAVDRDLVRSIDFGMFAFLVVPLLRALKWVNGWVGNYGWSIIILTILINAAMFPLRHKSVVSMRKMQEIQPEVKAIQDRYAKLKITDPARSKMNAELMNLYRERGVNPASGCVPMLLTLPVLFAFYSLLSVAIELRGAPFVGWIKDLSAHDPYYVIPVLMGVSMFWQQKMTPMTTADPVQQKMMMLMPVMFSVFSLWWPSGLVLYWFVSNMWAIGQQIVTNKLIGPPRAHVARPAAERRMKRVGSGSTDRAESSK
jgi:YidC/Oxa1 family membrane protein insertase